MLANVIYEKKRKEKKKKDLSSRRNMSKFSPHRLSSLGTLRPLF